MSDLLVKLLEGTAGTSEEQEFFGKARTIIAQHFFVSEDLVQWKSFKKESWHIDPPGRWFIDGKPLKIKLVLLGNESEE